MITHPIFVHFPIALFTVYALIEIFALGKRYPSLVGAKRLLIVLAFLGSIAATVSGLSETEAAEKAGNGIEEVNKLLELHEKNGIILTVLMALQAFGVIGKRLQAKMFVDQQSGQKTALKSFFMLFAIFQERKIAVVLAIIGLGMILLQGALGGLIVYGPVFDPLTNWVYGVVMG